MLQLEFPNENHKAMWEKVMQDMRSSGTELRHPDSIFSLSQDEYDTLLQNLRADRDGSREGRVPSTAFFLVKDDTILGALSLRHHINHPNLMHRGGHIGYGILPNERKKGYATQMLQLGLIEAQKLGLEKVLLTCSSENIASKRVIEKNGGVFESELSNEKGEKFLRFWITF